MSVNEAVYIFGRTAHQMRSHSFASVISPSRSVGSAVMITIFPVLSISTRAICTPAALTALTALVTSCCRNVDGARAMATPMHGCADLGGIGGAHIVYSDVNSGRPAKSPAGPPALGGEGYGTANTASMSERSERSERCSASWQSPPF